MAEMLVEKSETVAEARLRHVYVWNPIRGLKNCDCSAFVQKELPANRGRQASNSFRGWLFSEKRGTMTAGSWTYCRPSRLKWPRAQMSMSLSLICVRFWHSACSEFVSEVVDLARSAEDNQFKFSIPSLTSASLPPFYDSGRTWFVVFAVSVFCLHCIARYQRISSIVQYRSVCRLLFNTIQHTQTQITRCN